MTFQNNKIVETPIPMDPNTPFLVKESNTFSPGFIPSRKLVNLLIIGVLVGVLVVAYVCFSGNEINNNSVLHEDDDDLPLCATKEAIKAAAVVAAAGGYTTLNRRTARRGVFEGFSAKSNYPLKEAEKPSCIWTRNMLSWQKSGFHFQPKKNFMSDPNGPLLYKGNYHIFYQYNPVAAIWGNITWGHAISKDMIHWSELPFALHSDQWYDAFGVFTGSATILPDGKVIMLFTSGDIVEEQRQNLAIPADPSDPLLTKWVKYPGNPILERPAGIGPTDYRDPSTAWRTAEGKWRMTIGSIYNRTGISFVYDTIDFINFELRENLLHSVEDTGMWECIDFFPVSTTSDDALDVSYNGPNIKHVLKASMASMDDFRYDTYAIGTYNDGPGTWVPDDPTIDVGIGKMRYDWGTFYASKSFYDEEKKRRVLWGYVHEGDDEVNDVLKGWASIYNVPRTIVLDRKTGTNLLLWPVEEVEQLRHNRKVFNNITVEPGSVIPLDVGSAYQLDIEAEFEIDTTTLEGMKINDEGYTCPSSQGAAQRGALGPFGLLLLSTNSLSEITPVYFYIIKGPDGSFKTYFCSDQSRSSLANDVIKDIYGSTVPVLEGEKLTMRILVDHSIVESFAQGGRANIIARVYPTEAIYDQAKLFFFNNATDATIKASIQVWQMESAQML